MLTQKRKICEYCSWITAVHVGIRRHTYGTRKDKLTDVTYGWSWSGWRSNGWCSLWIERRLHLADVIQFNEISRFDMTL